MKIKKAAETWLFKQTDSNLINFVRYGFVGAAASVVDFGTYSALNFAHINIYAANTAGFILGLLTNYFLSRYWVFNQTADTMNAKEFLLFAIIGVGGWLISSGVLYVLVDTGFLGGLFPIFSKDIIKEIAKIAAMVITLIWNYVLRKGMYKKIL